MFIDIEGNCGIIFCKNWFEYQSIPNSGLGIEILTYVKKVKWVENLNQNLLILRERDIKKINTVKPNADRKKNIKLIFTSAI